MNKIKRIIYRIKNISHRWYGQWKYFSPLIAICDFLTSTIFRHSLTVRHYLNKYYYAKAQKIIENKYYGVIENWKNISFTPENIKDNSYIFIFWWQGMNNAPFIIKKCVSSIISHKGKHKIVIIDKTNWCNYTNVPEYIVEKFHRKEISVTWFSDILRCHLLYDNGGIWIDPTCYMSGDFNDEIYNYSFYSIRHGDSYEFPICKGKWATFFLASYKGNPLMGFLCELFDTYWKNEMGFIVYLSIDLFLSVAYDNLAYARKMINEIPTNNVFRDELRKKLIIEKGDHFYKILQSIGNDTYIHKLTYKMYIKKFS